MAFFGKREPSAPVVLVVLGAAATLGVAACAGLLVLADRRAKKAEKAEKKAAKRAEDLDERIKKACSDLEVVAKGAAYTLGRQKDTDAFLEEYTVATGGRGREKQAQVFEGAPRMRADETGKDPSTSANGAQTPEDAEEADGVNA